MAVGVGLTVMVKVTGDPVQLLALGVIVITVAIPVTGVKTGIEVTPV